MPTVKLESSMAFWTFESSILFAYLQSATGSNETKIKILGRIFCQLKKEAVSLNLKGQGPLKLKKNIPRQ
jgi:hypothetical protein